MPDVHKGAPLARAAGCGYIDIVKLLLTVPEIDVNKGVILWNRSFPVAPLARAAEEGHIDIVKLLLTVPEIDVNKDAPLVRAAGEGHIDIVKLLLTVPGIDVNKGNPLMLTVVKDKERCFNLLLANRLINVNKCDWLGNTALSVAEKEHKWRYIELLRNHPEIRFSLLAVILRYTMAPVWFIVSSPPFVGFLVALPFALLIWWLLGIL